MFCPVDQVDQLLVGQLDEGVEKMDLGQRDVVVVVGV
jgi:hypothetical protein